MHAKAVVDRSSVWEGDGSPDSTSRVPNIGDIDMSTVNRVLYQVTFCRLTLGRPQRCAVYFPYDQSCTLHDLRGTSRNLPVRVETALQDS